MKKAIIISIALAALILIAIGAFWFYKDDPIKPLPALLPADISIYDPALVEVIQQTSKRLTDNPFDDELRIQLAMIYEANGIFPLAEQTYRQCLELDPKDARAWYRLANIHEKVGQIDKAIEAIQRAAGLENAYAPIQWRQGLWLLESGKIDDAYNAFLRATEIASEEPAGWYGLARIALIRNQPQQAIDVINAHLLKGNTAHRGYQLLGRAHSLLGNSEKAKEAFAKTTTGELHWNDPWTTKAMAYQAGETAKRSMAARYVIQRDFNKAIPILEDLIKDKPDELSLLSQLGRAYAAIGQARNGMAILDNAWKSNPDNFQINYGLAEVIAKMPDATPRELDLALMYVNRAIDANATSSRAFTGKAMIQFRRNRPDSSIKAFKNAYQLDSRRTDQLVNAGFIECNLKQFDNARITFKTAIDRTPDLADAYVGYGIALTELGQLDDAQSALSRAQELKPVNSSRLVNALNRLKQIQRTGSR